MRATSASASSTKSGVGPLRQVAQRTLPRGGGFHLGVVVAQQVGPPAAHEVDELAAIHVPQPAALGALKELRVAGRQVRGVQVAGHAAGGHAAGAGAQGGVDGGGGWGCGAGMRPACGSARDDRSRRTMARALDTSGRSNEIIFIVEASP